MAKKRARKGSVRAARRERGRASGHRWARERATAAELDRLRRMLGRPGSDAPVRLQSKPGSSYRMADYLVFVILGIERDGFNYVSPADFWETAVGGAEEEDLRTAEFLQGFIEGALEVEHVVIEYDAATLDP